MIAGRVSFLHCNIQYTSSRQPGKSNNDEWGIQQSPRQLSDEVKDDELNHDKDELDEATILCDEPADDDQACEEYVDSVALADGNCKGKRAIQHT